MIKIAKYINSIQFVVICIICFQTMLVIDTATLLYTSFPDYMPPLAKGVAACVGSVTIESFLLMVSVNMYLIESTYGKRFIPVLLGVFGMVMQLFFMDTFSEAHMVVTYKRIFISFMFGFINYLLSDIFVKKWQEHTVNDDNIQTITNLQSEVVELRKLYETEKEYLEDHEKDYRILKNMHTYSEEQLSKLTTENEELKRKLSRKQVTVKTAELKVDEYEHRV